MKVYFKINKHTLKNYKLRGTSRSFLCSVSLQTYGFVASYVTAQWHKYFKTRSWTTTISIMTLEESRMWLKETWVGH